MGGESRTCTQVPQENGERSNIRQDDDEIGFDTVLAVDASWNLIRKIPNYEAVAGETLFRKIFELAPGALGMFSFGSRFGADDDGLYSHPLFRRHAKGVVRMLDAAIQMMGPDMDPLADVLKQLGAQHTAYGVLPPHYAVVGQALLYMLETVLGEAWTPLVQKGWEGIYHFVSTSMMKGAEEFLASRVAEKAGQTMTAPSTQPPPSSTPSPPSTKRHTPVKVTHKTMEALKSSSTTAADFGRRRGRGLHIWINKALEITGLAENGPSRSRQP